MEIQIMKKHILFLFAAGMINGTVKAQNRSAGVHIPKGHNQQVSFMASAPVGRFADSHLVGGGLSYNWSNHRFGDSVNARKWIGFTAQAGIDYFIGKKETVAGYPFRYGNNLYVQVMPGIICNPTPKSSVMLLAGPSLGIYKDASSLSLGVNLSGTYQLSPKVAVGPSVFYRKHAEVDALWTAGVKVGYVL